MLRQMKSKSLLEALLQIQVAKSFWHTSRRFVVSRLPFFDRSNDRGRISLARLRVSLYLGITRRIEIADLHLSPSLFGILYFELFC